VTLTNINGLRRLVWSLATLACATFGPAALAQTAAGFPSKSVNLVVPNPPGGFVDASARLLSDPLSRVLGQTVVIDNKSGGSGNVAYGHVARAARYGQTFELASLYVPHH